jgi:hypothetical protein
MEPRAGKLDQQFGENGFVFSECVADGAQITAATRPKGEFALTFACVGAGPVGIESYVWKIGEAGSDSGWGENGRVALTVDNEVSAVTSFAGSFDGQGRYYYESGTVTNAAGRDGLLRLTPAGQRDTSWGENGVVALVPPNGGSEFRLGDVVTTSGGDIIVAGVANIGGANSREDSPALVSINSQGGINGGFGPQQDGFFIQERFDPSGPEYDSVGKVWSTSSGDIVTGFLLGESLDLMRFTAQGRPTDWAPMRSEAARLLTPSGAGMVVGGAGSDFSIGTATGARSYTEDGEAEPPSTIDMGVAPAYLARGEVREDGRGGETYALGLEAGGSEWRLERYDAGGQAVEVAPAKWQPDVGWAGGWEWIPGRTRLVGVDEAHLWLAGVLQRERTDGTTDFRITVWRVWRY